MAFQRISILGVGLSGGLFALALRQRGFGGGIVGWDQADVLEKARKLEQIRTRLLSKELETEFREAKELHKQLKLAYQNGGGNDGQARSKCR